MTAKEAASLAPERMTAKEAAGLALQRRAAFPSGRAGAGHDRGESGQQAGTGVPASTAGRAMPAAVQQRMENAFAADFSDARVHPGSARATALGALAYTQGSDIHVAPGHWAPETRRGQELLGHELAHVVQQRQGRVRATAQLKGVALNDDPALEREADAMGARAARGEAGDQRAGAREPQATAGAIQRAANTKIVDIPPAVPGQAPEGELAPIGSGPPKPKEVIFGPLTNGCGTSVNAWLYPNDTLTGSSPSVRPSWWDDMNKDLASDADRKWVSDFVVQGHLLNENLGGPGNDMRNLTPIAKSTNAQHYANVEKPAMDIKAQGNIVHYTAVVDYSTSPDPAWFGNRIPSKYLDKFARKITCVLQAHDGTSGFPIGNEVESVITNAGKNQG
ncbi:DUF4157 domain-containing protein [Sorangium sp. So ce269]